MLDDMNLAVRKRLPELMDQPGLDERRHRQALEGLRLVNRISGSSGMFWPAFRELARQLPGRPLRALDVACGGGDVAVALARRAQRAGIDLKLAGCDVSPLAIDHATGRAARAGSDIDFFSRNVLTDDLPDGYDIITCSLFLHHLDEPDAIDLLRKMAAAARRLVLISDLRRTRFGYLLAWSGARLLSRSPIVHHDGPVSVAAAFSEGEVLDLARRAGLAGARLSRRWPQRFLLDWRPA